MTGISPQDSDDETGKYQEIGISPDCLLTRRNVGGGLTTVIVLGHGGGGTSAVAGVLNALGVRMGPRRYVRNWEYRNWANPNGTFESPDFFVLNRKILGRWSSVGLVDSLRSTNLRERSNQFHPEIEEAIRRNSGPCWGWKDSRNLFTIDAFLPLVEDPHLVIVSRSATEVSKSTRGKGERTLNLESDQLYRLEEQRIREILRDYPSVPFLELTYDLLMTQPRHVIQQLVEFLRLKCSEKEVRLALEAVLSPPELRERSRHLALQELATYPRFFLADLKTRIIQFAPYSAPTWDDILHGGAGIDRLLATFKKAVRPVDSDRT